jgi:hypothetical protein
VRRALIVPILAMLSVACSSEPPDLRGIDLPPAVTPASIPEAPWAVPFSVDFPAGYWTEGKHVYSIELICPILETELQTPDLEFDVSRFLAVFDGTIHLRLGGLSTTAVGAIDTGAINPGQTTRAIVTVIGAGRDAAEQAVDECAGLLHADGGEPIRMPPGTLFRP